MNDDTSRHRQNPAEGCMMIDGQRQQLHAWNDAPEEEVIASIPQNDGDTILEVVVIHHGAGAPDIELRSLVWGGSLGWYRQHTLPLSGAAVRDLLRSLGAVQRRMEHQRTNELASNVIPFPRTHRRHVRAGKGAAVATPHPPHSPSTGTQH